jgi:hypothetical protein
MINTSIILKAGLIALTFCALGYAFFLALLKHEQLRLIKSNWRYGIIKAHYKSKCFICESWGRNNAYALITKMGGKTYANLCHRCAADHDPEYVVALIEAEPF